MGVVFHRSLQTDYHLQDETKLQEITGKLYADDLIMQVAEGWINPKNWSLWNNREESPLLAIQALERQQSLFEFNNDDVISL